jgi:hypothetical protein
LRQICFHQGCLAALSQCIVIARTNNQFLKHSAQRTDELVNVIKPPRTRATIDHPMPI